MGGRWVLGIDAGGGGACALLVDLESGSVHSVRRAWRHAIAPGTGGWGATFDCRSNWLLVADAVREVLGEAGLAPSDVAGIAAAGMRHGVVVVGRDGRETWAVPNRDARAAAEATEFASEHGEAVYRATGLWPAPMLPLAKLRWLRENEPAILDDAAAVLSISDWVAWRLTGQVTSEPTQASASGLFDIAADGWSTELASLAGINPTLLPPIADCGSPIGELTQTAADALGLMAGTRVFAGGADTQLALLGAGATARGEAAAVCGTTMALQTVAGEPFVDPGQRLWSGRHAIERSWVVESNAGPAGEALEMVAGWFFPGDRNAVGRFLALAAFSPGGAGGMTSDIGATVFNASELGLPVGALSLSPLAVGRDPLSRAMAARAVVEGLAFALRANLEQVETATGTRVSALRTAGGLSRSATWCRVVADVLGRPVLRTRVPEASALGAAMCAAAGLGFETTLTATADRLCGPLEAFEPGADAEAYGPLFEDWAEQRALRERAAEAQAEAILRTRDDEPADEAGATFEPAGRPLEVLVTAPLDKPALERLRRLGNVRYEPFMEAQRVLTEEDLVEALAGVDALVTEVDVVDADSVGKLPRLRAVFTCRADPVNVDVEACTAHGVAVMNAPGRNARAVAELTLAFALALTRKPLAADRFMHDPATGAGDIARMGMAHAEFEGRELSDMTIGLVGYGFVGREVANALRPLAGRVVAADPFASVEAALADGVELVSLKELLAASDIVSLHAPVTDATRGMIGEAEFGAMRPGALFINTARAALVDEAALLEALRSGHLGGAALDVFAQEPPGHDHPLLALPNLIATPHIAGNTADVARRQGEMVCEAVEALAGGRRPATLLNPAVLASFGWDGPRRAPSEAERRELRRSRGPSVTDLEAEEDETAVAAPVKASRLGKLWKSVSSRTGRAAAPVNEVAVSGQTVPASANGVAYWESLFGSFVARVPGDPAIRRFAASKNVMVRYHVQDVGIVFHTGFTGDPPVAGMGEPPGTPHLTLRMTSAVLDDVFMERISGMKAAMSGKMAFSGNTMRAMALQRVQKDLNRVYRAAREEHGNPPEEAAAPSAGVSPASSHLGTLSSGATPSQAGDGGRLTAPVGDERDEMMAIVDELFASHLLTSTGGNVSVRRPDHPEELWITPSALPKGHLHAAMLVRIGLDGEPLDDGSLAPSSERLLHTAIYRDRPEIEAVVHSHGPRAFALGLSGLPFLPVSTESAFIGELPRVPFIMPGTEELAEATALAMVEAPAALLVNHGLVAAGRSLRRAADMTAVIEQTAGALMECHAAGTPPPVLPPEIVAQLREIGEMMA